jgi:uncharacterized protein YkwD
VVRPKPTPVRPVRREPADGKTNVAAQPSPDALPAPSAPEPPEPDPAAAVGDDTLASTAQGPPAPVAPAADSPAQPKPDTKPESDPDTQAVAAFVSACDSRQASLEAVCQAWSAVRPVVTRADQASRKHAERVARALLSFRKRALDQVDATARAERQATAERWPRLAALRAAALAAINDQAAYAEADHGQAGQPAVDAAVGALREAWDHAPSSLASPRVVQALAAVEATTSWLADLDVDPRRRGPTVADLRAALLAAASSRSLAPTPTDSRRRAADAKVRAWNDAAQMPDGCREVVRLLNDYREMLGLAALVVEPTLSKAAERHSAWMASTGRFDHVEDVQGRRLPEDRCRAEGYGAEVGENLASGCGDAATAFAGWYGSPGHHRNMVAATWGQVGTGRSGTYWTQVFGAAKATLR